MRTDVVAVECCEAVLSPDRVLVPRSERVGKAKVRPLPRRTW